MVSKSNRAVLALEFFSARAAQHERREAAPVEKQDRLIAGGKRLADRGAQRRRQHRIAIGNVRAQIDDLLLVRHEQTIDSPSCPSPAPGRLDIAEQRPASLRFFL